ncbi:hypothetical protein [Peribacillus muralis]|uniref:hypothetical protein n=1 Tax=Peribacillus muralis TaxID=264697 RepID=UPI003D0412C1
MKTNDEATWEIIKDIFTYIKYNFLSKERKFSSNVSLVKEKYWFQELLKNKPAINRVIEEDKELREYFSSRKKVRKLLRDKEERNNFKKLIKIKVTI